MKHLYTKRKKRFLITALLLSWGITSGVTALAQPTITATVPAANARAVPQTSTVTVGFSQALTAGSAAALKVYSAQRGGLRTRGTTPAVVNGSTLSFAPTASPFMPGETVTSIVTTAAAGAGGRLVRPQVVQFTAAVSDAGMGNFLPQAINPNPVVGLNAYSVALGDVDGDGDLDFVVANLGTGSVLNNTVSVRLNDGTGNFSGGSTIITGTDPSSVALGDLDGDGDLDFVCANYFARTVSVRLNNGNGIFLAPAANADLAVAGGPINIALGDVDGDGDLDFATANYLDNTVGVRLNDGRGNFAASAASTTLAVGEYPRGIVLGDADGDGDLDMLVANSGGNTVSVCSNDGTGRFTTAASTAVVVNTGPYAIAAGDVDGDGDLDLLTANYGTTVNRGSTVSVRLNDGNGRFRAPATNANPTVGFRPVGIAVGDVDGDGDLDFVAANLSYGTVSVRLNNGSGSFAAPATNADPALGGFTQHVTMGDVDGDGDLDLLAGNYNNTVGVLINYSPPVVPMAVRIIGDTLLCNAGQLQLTTEVVGPVVSYQWSTGATTPGIPVTQAGTYSVTATFSGGATRTAQRRVRAFVPAVQIVGDSLLCSGTTFSLSGVAGPNATAYRWSTGATTATIAVAQPGTYAVVVSYGSGCQSSARRRVRQVPALAPFSLGADTTLCEGTALLLRASVAGSGDPAVAYRWSTGATTPTLLVQLPGEYSLQITSACETRTASRRIGTRPCITIPNIITPNGDSRNDLFVVLGLTGDWQLQVYSRWGKQLYTTSAYRNDWGSDAVAGAYYYVLHQPGNAVAYKGWLEVVR